MQDPVVGGDDDVEHELTAGSAHVPLDPGGAWRNLERRVFATNQFFRLWMAQVVTSTGEWVFFLAIALKARDVGTGTPEAAVAFVLAARLGPGFFLGQIAGVLADRWDRRKLMAVCDVARAGIVMTIPFLSHVWQLVLVSLALEAFTLLWIPSKEALVPNLIPKSHLATANSLSMLATYGTFPLALVLMFVLDGQSGTATAPAFIFDAATFVVSAFLIVSIGVRGRSRWVSTAVHRVDDNKLSAADVWGEIRDGWRVVLSEPTVRAVNLGLAVGLIGGGMLIPLGAVYAEEVLLVDNDGYFAMLMGLGVGVGLGVLAVLMVQNMIRKELIFAQAVFFAGLCLAVATSVTPLFGVVLGLAGTGVCVGMVYVLGFTILQETVDDELRGRVFAALYSLARAGVLIAMVAAPGLAVALDRITELTADGAVSVFGYSILIPGVRITFWLAALIIMTAGVFTLMSMRHLKPKGATLRAVRE